VGTATGSNAIVRNDRREERDPPLSRQERQDFLFLRALRVLFVPKAASLTKLAEVSRVDLFAYCGTGLFAKAAPSVLGLTLSTGCSLDRLSRGCLCPRATEETHVRSSSPTLPCTDPFSRLFGSIPMCSTRSLESIGVGIDTARYGHRVTIAVRELPLPCVSVPSLVQLCSSFPTCRAPGDSVGVEVSLNAKIERTLHDSVRSASRNSVRPSVP
jgi:hypothetical protein